VAADHRANFAAERGRCDALIAELLKATADLDGREGILTGQRRGEVAGMTLGEISDDFAIWTLPGERTKNGAAHTVPLSAPARDLLRALMTNHANKRGANGGFLLPGAVGNPFAGRSKAKRALDKAILNARARAPGAASVDPVPPVQWSVHDLRRTVATGLQPSACGWK